MINVPPINQTAVGAPPVVDLAPSGLWSCADANPGLRCAPPWAKLSEPYGLQSAQARMQRRQSSTHVRRIAPILPAACGSEGDTMLIEGREVANVEMVSPY